MVATCLSAVGLETGQAKDRSRMGEKKSRGVEEWGVGTRGVGLRDHVDERAWMQDPVLGLVSWADSSQVCSDVSAPSALY